MGTRYVRKVGDRCQEKNTADAVAKLQGLETVATERVVITYAMSPEMVQ